MKKGLIIAIVVIVIIVAALAVWYFAIYSNDNIGASAAKNAALADLGVTAAEVHDLDCDYENEAGQKYYDVTFDYDGLEYDYAIDAKTGEVLNVRTESVFD